MSIFKLLTDLKDTAGICEYCQQHFEPIFITRNGEPELVIMSADFFNDHFRFRDANGKLDFAKEFSVPMTIPIRDMKLTSCVSALCLESDQPISIIKNGEIAMVVMSVDVYKHRHQDLMRLLQKQLIARHATAWFYKGIKTICTAP